MSELFELLYCLAEYPIYQENSKTRFFTLLKINQHTEAEKFNKTG